jgi:hypothetical protein
MTRKPNSAILITLALAGASFCAAAQDTAPPATAGAHPAFFQRLLKKTDSNGDGRISLDEYLAAAKARFARLDTNGDGFLQADELAAGHRWARPGGKHGGGD